MSGTNQRAEQLIRCYDLVAEDYGDAFRNELDEKPKDRELLKRLADGVRDDLPLCDLGCGPGHVAAYLESLGVAVLGIDLSPRMIDVARRLFPSIEYRVGDMLDLDLPDGSLGGIVAFYSVIHLGRGELIPAFREMLRVLAPGATSIVSFHRGEGELRADEWFGKPVSFECTLFELEEVADAMGRAGFIVDEVIARLPYEREHPTERVYVIARRPTD